jgi:two-component system, NarL family, sensor histidine kinase EvgS
MSAFNKNNVASVLVVDDEAISRTISAKMVEALGWAVETAASGEEALSLWQAKRHPLIITDCQMSNMDGFSLTKVIRHIENSENVEKSIIIALTANADEEEKNRCKHAGMNDFLTKPISLEKLKMLFSTYIKPFALNHIKTTSFDSNHEFDNQDTPIDYAILDQVFPDSDKQIKILQDLQRHVHDNYQDLQLHIKQANVKNVESTAHRMKGSCKMVGVNQIANICAEIETQARSGCIATDLTLITLNENIRQFDAYLQQESGQPDNNNTPLSIN